MDIDQIAEQLDNDPTDSQIKHGKGALLRRFFQNAPAWVVKECQYITIGRDTEFIREEEPAHMVYILVSGSVNATDYRISDTAYSFKKYEPLMMFGDIELIIHARTYITTLRTCTECSFITMPMRVYEKWMHQDLDAFWIQTELMTGSFVSGARKDRSFLFLDATERMQVFLTNLYESKAKNGALHVRMTRKNLADEIGCSVRTVNRALAKLQKEGRVQVVVSDISVSEAQYRLMKKYIDEKISEI